MKKFLYIMPVLLLSACSSVNTQQNQRLESIEEKVDALLVYNNKTYDIMVDNELRISELEKDAKVRGVPVPQKNITVDSLPSPHAVIKNEEPQPLPEQEASAVKNVGALTGQDLTSQDLANQPLTKAEEKNQLQVTENIVEAPKQEQAAETGKQTALHPEGAFLIGHLFNHLLKDNPSVTAVGGLTLGADPLVTATSVISYQLGRPLPAFIVRKNPKGHGTNQYLEGLSNLQTGKPVAMLEDVVTTGGSLLTACERVKEAGFGRCACGKTFRSCRNIYGFIPRY